MKKYRYIIGLEIHIRILSSRKLFSYCKVGNVSKYDLAIPGTMPNLNKTLIVKTLKFLKNFKGELNKKLEFYRKCYFYPDISKGYQITQNYMKKNCFLYNFNDVVYLIKNLHMEEDTASIKYIKKNKIIIDYKRIGLPLLELVSFPNITSLKEAILYLKIVKNYSKFCNFSNARMEMGEFKFDVNISSIYKNKFSNRMEIKNLNSYVSLRKSVRFEIYRLINKKIKKSETRSYSQNRNKTYLLRKKESFLQYSYVREFDLKVYKTTNLSSNFSFINIYYLLKTLSSNNLFSFERFFINLNINFFQSKKKNIFIKKRKSSYKNEFKLIDYKLLNKIILTSNINKKNKRYLNYIIGKYIKLTNSKNIDYINIKKFIKMKERDSNP
ncbi:hypothetical protein [Candidatus Vidania fulgoroideorum]